MKEIIFEILGDMAEELSVMQLKKLQEVLIKRMMEKDEKPAPASNDTYLEILIFVINYKPYLIKHEL